MRKMLAVAIALLPVALHAQASSPAATQSAVNPSHLEARLSLPAEPGQDAAAMSDFDSAPANAPRVSTGIVAPQIVSTVDVVADNDMVWRATGDDKKVVVSLTVDKTGKPSNLKIEKSTDPDLDQNVLNSVSEYKFKPGTLNNQPTAVDVDLEVVIHAPTR